MRGLVLYTDGGFVNGVGGYGVHGYLYDTLLTAKGVGLGPIVATTQGYYEKEKDGVLEGSVTNAPVELTLDDVSVEGKIVMVTPVSYVDMYGTDSMVIEGISTLSGSTNNRAELRAMIVALKYIAETKPECVTIRPDSEYVRRGIVEWSPGWIKRNWIRPDGSTVPNVDMWLELIEVLNTVKALNIPIRYTWVKGHSGETGNERVDKLATLGLYCAIKGKDHHVIDTKAAEGFWKYATEKHPFIAHRRLYFNTLNAAFEPGIYYLGDHGKDDDRQGTRISDGSCSVVRIAQPDPVIESIRYLQAKVALNADVLYLGYLDRIFSSDIHRDLNTYGELIIEPIVGQRTDLTIKRGKDVTIHLTHEQNPPRISWRVIDSVTLLSDILDQFLAKDPQVTSTDITDVIYQTLSKAVKPKKAKKGEEALAVIEEPVEMETKLRPEYVVGCPSVKVQGQYRLGDDIKTAEFVLATGIDILDRNSLKRLEEKNPKVYFLTWKEGPALFRYATVITAGADVGIWAGVHSNIRMLVQ